MGAITLNLIYRNRVASDGDALVPAGFGAPIWPGNRNLAAIETSASPYLIISVSKDVWLRDRN